MRKLFFVVSVVMTLLVSMVFTVQKAFADPPPTGTVSWTCISGGAQLTWTGATIGETWHLHSPANGGGVDLVLGAAAGSNDYLEGNGNYRIHDLNHSESRPSAQIAVPCVTPVVVAVVVVEQPSIPFWKTDQNADNRMDPIPGEKYAVYCFGGGFVDIWDTFDSKGKVSQFATTTYSALNGIPAGGTSTLNNLLGGTFTASKDATGKFITISNNDGTKTKSINLDKCAEKANDPNYVAPNNPLGASYTTKTSDAIAFQLDVAKKRLASAVGAAAVASAQADVARWQSLYSPNNTVITLLSDGAIAFQFSDGKLIIVLKDGRTQ